MKLLNLCCGAVRPQSEEWTNLDLLLPVLGRHSDEWKNLQQEKNYVEHDVLSGPLPFDNDTFDGVLMSHCLEHWDCGEAERILKEVRRIMKNGGAILASVPDATYFREVYDRDTVENAVELFGEPIHLPDGEKTFTGYALWCPGRHRAIMTEDVLWHYLKRAEFPNPHRFYKSTDGNWKCHCSLSEQGDALIAVILMQEHLNRLPFSLVMHAVKE